MIGTAKRLVVERYLQVTNRCLHTVAPEELTRYRELLKRFIPRSYTVSTTHAVDLSHDLLQ